MRMPVWLIPVFLACAPLALADTVKLLPSAMEMPDRIGPLAYTGKPSDYSDPRLGKSYAYVAAGVQLDIYVYDAGVTGIPEGAVSQPVCQQFEMAMFDVLRGGYKDLVVKGERLARMGPTQDPPLAREIVFEAAMRDVPMVSYLWVTAVGGNFIKLRFSMNAKLRHELESARRVVLDAVGDAIRPHLAPPAPQSEENRKNRVVVVGTAGDPADLKFKLLYLAAISVKADKPSHPLPPCGGPLQPEFSDEVAAYQLALSGSDDGKAGAYAKQLAEVNKAGFLKEYIWINRHQSSWGSTEPKGLKLAKFRKWSRKNLKPVAATQLGYVNITQVRELPVEPLSGAE